MKKIIPIIFCLILINFALLSAISYPHGFYGTAQYTNGANIPDGYIVTGEVNGAVAGSCKIVDGRYDLVLVDEDDGGEIKFYIQGKEADQTSIFKTFEVTELTLTIDSDSNFDDEFCGDGSCNNGETYSNCPIDCDDNSPSNTNSGGNNNNGGSGGGGDYPSNKITQTIDSDRRDNSNPKTIDELNNASEKSTTKNQISYSSKIQGAFIGFAKSPGGIVSIIFLNVLTGTFVFFMFKKFIKKNSEKKDSEEINEDAKS
jgi:hypothetical protein